MKFQRPLCQIAVKNPTNVGSLYLVTYSKEGYEGICVLYQTAPARQLQTDLYLCQKNVTRRPEGHRPRRRRFLQGRHTLFSIGKPGNSNV
jgi:hypothetical protein